MSKYFYNKDYFKEINSANKAYWLGFLYADGCITRTYKNEKLKNMVLEITLCNEDRHHLEKFRDCLESNLTIHDKLVHGKEKDYKSSRLVVSCTNMCRDLIKLGCTPQKTYDIKFPSYDIVPHEFMRDFVRGFFDGDGCICITKMAGKPHIELTLTGMSDMLKSIADFLISEKILRVIPKLHKDNRSRAYSMHMYGEDAIKDILDYLYKDSEIYLDRKFNKYKEFYKDYDENKPRYGVYYSDRNKAYIVRISINGKTHRIGQFKNVKEANAARIQAELEKINNIQNAS